MGLKSCSNNHPSRKSHKHRCTPMKSTCGALLQAAVHGARGRSPRPSGPAGDLQWGKGFRTRLSWEPGSGKQEAATFLCYSASVSLKSPLNQSVFASEVLNVPWHLPGSNYKLHMTVICSFPEPLLRALSRLFYEAPLEVVTVQSSVKSVFL